MNREDIVSFIESLDLEGGDTILLIDGHDSAFLGIDQSRDKPRAVYSESKIIDNLVDDQEMTLEDAIDYYQFNIAAAYVGEQTPLILLTR